MYEFESRMPTLSSIATIRSGATLRGRDATRPDPQGSYRLVRIGDVSDHGVIEQADFPRITPNESISAEQILRHGDILFPGRGTRTTAATYRLDLDNAIVGAQFFVIRTKKEALPEYVAWYLRSEPSRQYFEQRRKGTYVQLIQRVDVAELEIPLPPMNVQHAIAEMAKIQHQDTTLVKQIADLKEQLLQYRLLHTAEKSSH